MDDCKRRAAASFRAGGFRAFARAGSWALGVIGFIAFSACTSAVPPPSKPPKAARQLEQGNLLLFPVAQGESLLGRPVRLTEDGSWTIADSRLPTCEVRAVRKEAKYKVQRTVDVDTLTALSAGFAKLVDIQTQFGEKQEAEISIENTATLVADMRGDCGETVVDKVFVGRGRRRLLSRREIEGGAHGVIGQVTPQVEHQSGSELIDETSWSDEQAYAFTFKKMAPTESLELTVALPPSLLEGENLSVTVQTNQRAWLVVLYIDASGKGAVLWPSPDEPAPIAEAGTSLVLPTERERQKGVVVRATLAEPGQRVRETLVAYAFAHEADFKRVRDLLFSTAEQGSDAATRATQALSSIPLSRWGRALQSYEIVPNTQLELGSGVVDE